MAAVEHSSDGFFERLLPDFMRTILGGTFRGGGTMHLRQQLASAALALLPAFGLAQASHGEDSPSSRCPPAPPLEKATQSVDTSVALKFLSSLLAGAGIDFKFRTARDLVLADNPRADQMVIALTILHDACLIIWADANTSSSEKLQQLIVVTREVMQPAAGPAPIMKTGPSSAPPPDKRGAAAVPIALIARRPEAQFAQAQPQQDPHEATGPDFLREPPLYVNDFNKYFVIVGSAKDESSGRSLIERFKAKAPQYEFALYAPYGANSYYGVMMASWVSLDVARQVLAAAKRDVAAGAYLWACPSQGESC